MTCPHLIESGVYVLGALPPAQRLTYERHLAGCVECRAEVGDLAVLPGLLGRLDEPSVTAAVAIDPVPPSVLAGALSRVRRRRRVRRFAAFAGAMAVACVALIAGLALPRSDGRPVTHTPSVAMHEMQPVIAAGAITASVGLSPATDGTRIDLTCWYSDTATAPYAGPSANYALFAFPRNGGAPRKVLTWAAKPGETVMMPGNVPWPPDQVSRIELRTESGTTLLQYTVT